MDHLDALILHEGPRVGRLEEGWHGDGRGSKRHGVSEVRFPHDPLALDFAISVDVDGALGVGDLDGRLLCAGVAVCADRRCEHQHGVQVGLLQGADDVLGAADVDPKGHVSVSFAVWGQDSGKVKHGVDTIDRPGYIVRVGDVSLVDLDAVVVFKPGEVHLWQVEDSDRLARVHKFLDQLSSHTARAASNEYWATHVRVVPFIPAFSMTF